jgi:hypothetical protein
MNINRAKTDHILAMGARLYARSSERGKSIIKPLAFYGSPTCRLNGRFLYYLVLGLPLHLPDDTSQPEHSP